MGSADEKSHKQSDGNGSVPTASFADAGEGQAAAELR